MIADLDFLKTLSSRDFSAGMAEVIKCGFIADPEILKIAGAMDSQSQFDNSEEILELISRAVAVKADVAIKVDEMDVDAIVTAIVKEAK